jgi:hypothetical protein
MVSSVTPGLSFSPGLGVQSAVHARFGIPVNHFPGLGLREFFLMVSFGRCKFQLSEETAGLLIQATVGGVAADFRPQQLSARVFKFVVASRDVGFHIAGLKSFPCDNYKIFFHLWGNGGPHWISEFKKFLAEEEHEWTTVVSKKEKQRLRSMAARQSSLFSGASKVPIGPKISRDNTSSSGAHQSHSLNFGEFSLAFSVSKNQLASFTQACGSFGYQDAAKIIWRVQQEATMAPQRCKIRSSFLKLNFEFHRWTTRFCGIRFS